MFSLKLFGRGRIDGPRGPLTGRAAQRQRLALLALLAVASDRGHSRDKLLALLCPESDTHRARHLLSDTVYLIRRELGEGAVLTVGDDLLLNSELVRSDLLEFEEALAAGDFARAVELYTGPLLDGFHLGAAPEFERWLEAERERLARACAGALEQLAEEAGARGDIESAAGWWRRLVAEDPYNSRLTARLMEALAAAGDRASAMQQARLHATLLEQEFGAEPDPEVTALAERLRREPIVVASNTREARMPDSPAAVAVGPAYEPDARDVPTSSLPVTPPARSGTNRRAVALPTTVVLGFAAVLLGGWLLSEMSARPGAVAEVSAASSRAIVVLPFVNLSRDPEEEYFSDGLTEELISVLSQVRALDVVARTSAFAFKGEDRDIREIGRALNVGTVLEGSVRKVGDRVRVTAQLINASDGFHLWSQTYEREVTDVTDLFAVWSDISLRIAGALEAELSPAERARLARRPTTNPEAYALYLKGRYFWNQRTPGGFAQAIEYYEHAIETDPRYAAAYAGLAMAYSLQGLSGALPPQQASERMRVAALKAVELDEQSAEAHSALGSYLNVYAWDSEASERAHLRSIELDPNYGTARHMYGNLLRTMGHLEDAVVQKRKAIELDPLAPQLSNSLGYTLLEAGRPAEALEAFRSALELDSTFAAAHAGLGEFYAATGRLQEAVRAHQRAVGLAGANRNARAGLARVLALAGSKDEARRMLGELQRQADRSGVFPPVVAWVFLALDDADGALAWLERSYRQRHPGLRFISRPHDPRLANDPRFVDLLRRIGLPP